MTALRARRDRRIGRIARGFRRRQLGEILRELAQVVVGHVLGEIVHDLDLARVLPEQKKLDQREIGRLACERRHLAGLGNPLLAVAGEAGGELLVIGHGVRAGGEHAVTMAAASSVRMEFGPARLHRNRKREAACTPPSQLANASLRGGALLVAVGHAPDRAVEVVGDQHRAVLEEQHVDRPADIAVVLRGSRR